MDICENDVAKCRGQRLKRLRNLANLTRKQLCEYGDINMSSYKGWEIGRHGGLTSKAAQKVISILAQHGVVCELGWLVYGDGNPPAIIANHTQSTVADDELSIKNELAYFQQTHPNATSMMIADDAMLPNFKLGEYVAGIKYHHDKLAMLIDEIVIVETTTHGQLLRKLANEKKANHYRLVASNKKIKHAQIVLSDTELLSVAPVIWHRRKNSML